MPTAKTNWTRSTGFVWAAGLYCLGGRRKIERVTVAVPAGAVYGSINADGFFTIQNQYVITKK
jgi:hypothetical protein